MTFRITGIDPAPFVHLYGLSDADLERQGAKRYRVDESPGFPDRIEMRDAAVGETMLLVNYVHQPAKTPYYGCHAIFVREGATTQYAADNVVPDVLRRRILSLRGFDADGMLRDADVTDGREIEAVIARLFDNPDITYIQAHNAKQGCYAGRIDRL
jgi:Protein of unknown function (DUF1203)